MVSASINGYFFWGICDRIECDEMGIFVNLCTVIDLGCKVISMGSTHVFSTLGISEMGFGVVQASERFRTPRGWGSPQLGMSMPLTFDPPVIWLFNSHLYIWLLAMTFIYLVI